MNTQAKLRLAPTLIVHMLLSSCASFQPSLDERSMLAALRVPTAEKFIDALRVSVEEFAAPEKSQLAFDSDVVPSGVIPLLVRIENRMTSSYKISAENVRVYIETSALERLPAEKAAKEAATRDYVGKALGWTIVAGAYSVVAWPAALVGSAVHTRNVNSRIIKHFEILEFKGGTVQHNQTIGGFLYFQIPANMTVLRNIAETKAIKNLKIELTAIGEPESRSVTFEILLPSLNLQPPSS